jgi:hypothetical protein
MSYAAVSLNLDSMDHAFGYPAGYEDPTFGPVMDRFEEFADQFRFRYSVYVIGRDLEKQRHRAKVRGWAERGHEIGNHTWNHYTNLGALPKAELTEEIHRTHSALADATGQAPNGFIAPAWSYSDRMMDVLAEQGYAYDTSLFPSLLYYPFVFKNAWNHRTQGEKFWRVLDRRDWLAPLTGSREPYLDRGMVMLPVPSTPGPFGLTIWHTTGFLLGWEKHFAMLRAALAARKFFYYVVHPADLTCDQDFPDMPINSLERIGGSLEEKQLRFEQSLQVIADARREWVTLRELARRAKTELS